MPILPHKFLAKPTQYPHMHAHAAHARSFPPNKAQEMVERATPLSAELVTATARLANLGVSAPGCSLEVMSGCVPPLCIACDGH